MCFNSIIKAERNRKQFPYSMDRVDNEIVSFWPWMFPSTGRQFCWTEVAIGLPCMMIELWTFACYDQLTFPSVRMLIQPFFGMPPLQYLQHSLWHCNSSLCLFTYSRLNQYNITTKCERAPFSWQVIKSDRETSLDYISYVCNSRCALFGLAFTLLKHWKAFPILLSNDLHLICTLAHNQSVTTKLPQVSTPLNCGVRQSSVLGSLLFT